MYVVLTSSWRDLSVVLLTPPLGGVTRTDLSPPYLATILHNPGRKPLNPDPHPNPGAANPLTVAGLPGLRTIPPSRG